MPSSTPQAWGREDEEQLAAAWVQTLANCSVGTDHHAGAGTAEQFAIALLGRHHQDLLKRQLPAPGQVTDRLGLGGPHGKHVEIPVVEQMGPRRQLPLAQTAMHHLQHPGRRGPQQVAHLEVPLLSLGLQLQPGARPARASSTARRCQPLAMWSCQARSWLPSGP